jgi:hypothetical protein
MYFPIDLSHAQWRKSSHSGGGNDTCVEVAPVRHVIAVRDSKNPGAEPLGFSRSEWQAFAARVRKLS